MSLWSVIICILLSLVRQLIYMAKVIVSFMFAVQILHGHFSKRKVALRPKQKHVRSTSIPQNIIVSSCTRILRQWTFLHLAKHAWSITLLVRQRSRKYAIVVSKQIFGCSKMWITFGRLQQYVSPLNNQHVYRMSVSLTKTRNFFFCFYTPLEAHKDLPVG